MKKNRVLNHTYRPTMIEALQKHVDEGGSVISFAGVAQVPHDKWAIWVREIPELQEINKAYQKKMNSKRSFMIRAIEG